MTADEIEIPEVPISLRTIVAQKKRAAALKRIIANQRKKSEEVQLK
jgi:hypothetical protein